MKPKFLTKSIFSFLGNKPENQAVFKEKQADARKAFLRMMWVPVLASTMLFAGIAQAQNISFEEKTQSAATGTSLTINAPNTGWLANDLLLATITQRDSDSVTPPAGWATVDVGSFPGKVVLGIFYKVITDPVSEPASYIFTLGVSQETTGAILRYRNVDISDPIDAVLAQNAKSLQPIAPSVSTLTDETMVVSVFGQKDAIGITSVTAVPDTLPAPVERVEVGLSGKILMGVYDRPKVLAASTGGATPTVTFLSNIDKDKEKEWRGATVALKKLVPSADIQVFKTRIDLNGGVVEPGDQIRYEVAVKNNGPNDSGAVSVTDPLPAGMTYVSHQILQGSGSYSPTVGTLGLPNGIASGAPFELLEVIATVDAGGAGKTITNTATAIYSNDPDPTNNSASASIDVAGSDLAVTNTVNPTNVQQGEAVAYTVTVTNNGPDAITSGTGVTVNQVLGSAFESITSSATQGSYDAVSGNWTFSGGLAVNGSATLTINATVTTQISIKGILFREACITSSNHNDGVTSNDCARAALTVKSRFDENACIIDMGADADNDGVQTINEGLRPYGLLYTLLTDHNIPIQWVIASPKTNNNSIDVTINGKEYRHGPFVIEEPYVNLVLGAPDAGITVRQKLAAWAAANPGFVYDCDLPSFEADVFDTLTVWPRSVLETENGAIAAAYYQNAGFPPLSNPVNTGTDYTFIGRPRDLTACHDLFIMPHADPHTGWIDGGQGDLADGTTATVYDTIKLLKFIEQGGQFWAGCHAVSSMERLTDVPSQAIWDAAGEIPLPETTPGQTPTGIYFLTTDDQTTDPTDSGGLIWTDFEENASLNPFTLDQTTSDSPFMQFMGGATLGEATRGGSQQIYLPDDSDKTVAGGNSSAWRGTTTVAIYDENHENLPGGTKEELSDGKAAVLAYGRAFGNDDYGYVIYEAGHDLNKGNGLDGLKGDGDVAAQRALMNLHFITGVLRRPEITGTIETARVERKDSLDGLSASFTVTGLVNPEDFNYTWYDYSCGGKFFVVGSDPSDPNNEIPSPATVASGSVAQADWYPGTDITTIQESLECVVGVNIEDECIRGNFVSLPVNVIALDIGDAPASYEAAGQAAHEIWAGAPFLGFSNIPGGPDNKPDAEDSDVTPSFSGADANGDDNSDPNFDDENGLVEWIYSDSGHIVSAFVMANNPNPTEPAMLCGYLDGGNTLVMNGAFDRDGSDTDEEVCVTVPPSTVNDPYELQWKWNYALSATTYGRFRITTDPDFFSTSSPSPNGTADDGEIEDHPIDITPTAVTIGSVELQAAQVSDFLSSFGVDSSDTAALLALLEGWDPEAAANLAGAGRQALIAALRGYLDPDGDGEVAVLSWETLEERGTIGFYVDRRQTGTSWVRVNNSMLPGLITAPMGGEYALADPVAQAGEVYQYMLIEQEARGKKREYGPFTVEMSQ